MGYFVDVILPLPLNQKFTYLITYDEFKFIKPGMRIIVPFGKSKLYTSIASKVHNDYTGNYELKNIIQIIDNNPIVNEYQLKFWDWISRYYFAFIGDVMRASIPSNYILQSETEITLNSENLIEYSELDQYEFLIIEALEISGKLSLKDVSKIINKKNVFSIINEMNDKNIIRINEKIYSKYSQKLVKCVRFNKNFKMEFLNQIPKNAKKQLDCYNHLKKLNSVSKDDIRVSEFKLITSSYLSVLKKLAEKKIIEFYDLEVKRNIIENSGFAKTIILSEKQSISLNQINKKFETKNIVLFKGITSSGKTEIYIKKILSILKLKNQILYLVPEIALTTQLVERLKIYFPENLVVYHSGLNINQRAELWSEILNNKKPQLVIGARSAIFLPYSNLKLIIIDEEHELSYKQFEPSPRYHARDSALVLSNIHNSKVILGSATPSIESYYNSTKLKKYGFVELNQRYRNIPLPEIKLIDLSQRVASGLMHGIFSEDLLSEIRSVTKENKQVILFQNRRGYSPVLQCNSCGALKKCINCDVSLTYHHSRKSLRCHYCGFQEDLYDKCFECGSHNLLSKGFGTEQIELELKEFFPELKITRLDYDTTRGKNNFKKIINSFENGEFDILIGTQMVTKGLDFKNVQLVGIMNLDNLMSFPDFRSFERCYQLVQQVAGRAGRSDQRGQVIIQAHNCNSKFIDLILKGDYEKFFQEQVKDRNDFSFPPFVKLIKITLKHRDLNKVNNASDWFFKKIYPYFKKNILGPEFPYISRIRNKYQKNILVKIPNDYSLSSVKNIIKKSISSINSISDYRTVQIIIDVDPY